MTTANDILKQIKDDSIEYLDLRFTDPRGKMQHVTIHASQVEYFNHCVVTQFKGDLQFSQNRIVVDLGY